MPWRFTPLAPEAAGATGTRHSPRPLRGREINAQLGRIAPRGAKSCLLFDNCILLRRPCESRDPYAVSYHFGRGGRDLLCQQTPVAMGPCFRRDDERLRMELPVIASGAKQSILSLCGEMECFVEPVIGRAFSRPVGSQ